jgi:hypothetical protein
MTTERTETAPGATNGTPDRLSEGGDPFAAQDAARTVELPLAGRTMMDLGRQVAAWRARAEQAEAERDRLRAALAWAEWRTSGDHCGYCGKDKADGHMAGCWIDAALKSPGKRPQPCSICRRDDCTTEHACE